MAVEAEFLAFATLMLIPYALGIPHYSRRLYQRLADPRKYPEASRIFTSGGGIINENEAKGSARFLIDQATESLEIASLQLKASVWNEQAAARLQKALVKHPSLQVRVLTGQQITGDERGQHPFYLACRQESKQVSFGTIKPEAFSLLQGVRADGQLLRKSESSVGELAPANFWSRNSAPDRYWRATQADRFGQDFAFLWDQAEKRPATIMRAA